MPSDDPRADQPASDDAGPSPRGVDAARREIRDDEAKRLLGLLSPATLPARAARWLADGLDDPAAHDLADREMTEEARVASLATLAASQGVAFATAREAREHHARFVITTMTADTAGADSLSFSNSFTDGVSASARGALGRLFSRRRG
ncbi:hypothetical protein ACPEEZ_03600 [Frigoribacterium sp. 2-23]|uniref:hypothetical protein n=1 Tax=Frigoribacterium sp. 2-23 TaxID=3415006 RepID=UPI003C6ED939